MANAESNLAVSNECCLHLGDVLSEVEGVLIHASLFELHNKGRKVCDLTCFAHVVDCFRYEEWR